MLASNPVNLQQNRSFLLSQKLSEDISVIRKNYTQQLGRIIQALTKNTSPIFFLPMLGNSMVNAGIMSGDLLIINSDAAVQSGQIIIVLIGDKYNVGRYFRTSTNEYLVPENNDVAAIDISEAHVQLLGVVSYVVRGM